MNARQYQEAAGFAVRLGLIFSMVFNTVPLVAATGDVVLTPVTPMELPVEVEIELSPAGSLKQAALWKELLQLLEHPYGPDNVVGTADDGTIIRRPSFTATPLPPLAVYPLNYNFLTGQPMRLRTSDGEVSWDLPGPLFDPAEDVTLGQANSPNQNAPLSLRTPIGHIVAIGIPNNAANRVYESADIPNSWWVGKPQGALVIYNPDDNDLIPPDGTVVAVRATDGSGRLRAFNPGVSSLTGFAGRPVINRLEQPVNEAHFFRRPTDTLGVPVALQPLIGRPAAEILGKALFWDMQLGSDGVQSCGSCHFHAGVDNRSKNQLNPNHVGGQATNNTLEVFSNRDTPPADTQNPNQDVVAADFPFHMLVDPDLPSEDLLNPDGTVVGGNIASDADDVMSSMGVVRFTQFTDIPTPGAGAFIAGTDPKVLLPDEGTPLPEDGPGGVPVMAGLRRVEPRHTPTFHAAAFNNDNFWDGRARLAFNGGSVQGQSDPYFHIFVNNGTPAGGMHGLPNPDDNTLALNAWAPAPGEDPVPARIKFSSLASQSVGPPLSEFEMSFLGRNWPKIGKKLLQGDDAAIDALGALEVTPLANQIVSATDSVLGPFANPGGPGLTISYGDLIRLAFNRQLWRNTSQHLTGAANPADPFDKYVLSGPEAGGATADDTDEFSQMQANFSLFFGLSVQAYEELTIPDDTPADKFFDANPLAGHGVGEPGDQAVLFPTLIPDLLDDGELNGTNAGTTHLIADDPATDEFDGFGPDEVFGFDLFAGANLTAGLAEGESMGALPDGTPIDRNPAHTIQVPFGVDPTVQHDLAIRVGSNPFTRSAKCMLCHLGPEQTDASISIDHGILKNDAEFEFPTPPQVPDPDGIFPPNPTGFFAGQSTLPAPEPSGSSKAVPGLILSEEVAGAPQDAVEVEPRNMAIHNLPPGDTPWDDTIISQPANFAFGDQGVYNIGIRPIINDTGRGATDAFGWPLSNATLALINIAGDGDGNPATPANAFQPNDDQFENNVMSAFDPLDLAATFEETGEELEFPNAPGYTLQSINPGFEKDPAVPLLPAYIAPWASGLSAGELHPQIDEIGGMLPNTVTPPNGGPGIEFPEVLFGADLHCLYYDPDLYGAGSPNYGWGPAPGTPTTTDGATMRVCPQHQSGVAGNFDFPIQGTWPVPNRVIRDGAFKAPPLRNVELTGPLFHTGSYLTLMQVVDFYFRGGDFPVTNAENRDPHIVELNNHAFSFGRTTGADLRQPINFNPDGTIAVLGDVGFNAPATPYITGPIGFGDGLPDTVFLYDLYPDEDHPITPELTFPGDTFAERRELALEDAKVCIVKFLLALTDQRVRYEKAPFDHPQLFVPVDGRAPENTGGTAQLIAQSTNPLAAPVTVPGVDGILGTGDDVIIPAGDPALFRNIPAVGAAGSPTPVPSFLGISRTVVAGPSNDHFDHQ